jgi:hypothetical protein
VKPQKIIMQNSSENPNDGAQQEQQQQQQQQSENVNDAATAGRVTGGNDEAVQS